MVSDGGGEVAEDGADEAVAGLAGGGSVLGLHDEDGEEAGSVGLGEVEAGGEEEGDAGGEGGLEGALPVEAVGVVVEGHGAG